MALLHLLRERWPCTAVTVDHRLREGSHEDARFVARACAEIRVPHIVESRGAEHWGNMRRAREGRYERLARVAERLGAPVVTGHTLDDQAETVRMRARRGAGLGLSAIAPVATIRDDIPLLRPLLATSRAALRDHLVERGVAWIEDPSNAARRFERVRIREAEPPEDPARLAAFAHAARLHRAFAMRTIARDFRHGLARDGRGQGMRYGSTLGGTLRVTALRILAARTGHARFLPPHDRTAALVAAGKPFTIAGCTIVPDGAAYRAHMEPRRRAVPTAPQGPLHRFRPASDDPVHAALEAAFR